MKDNPAKTLELSREDFIQKVKGYSEALEHDQEARRKFTLQAGSLEKARAFINPKGVGISQLAKLADLPVTTVRHYQRLGLVTPYRVNGKFRFGLQHLVQVESVKQWRELGMPLEEIARRKQSGLQVLLRIDPQQGARVVLVRELSSGERKQIMDAPGVQTPSFGFSEKQASRAGLESAPLARQCLEDNYQALHTFLEERKAEIEKHLRQMEALQAARLAPRKPEGQQDHE